MKKVLLPLLLLLGGLGVGGAAAFVTGAFLGPRSAGSGVAVAADQDLTFVPVRRILAPLVMADGRLAGYVSVDIELQVPAGQAESVAVRLPLLRHALNMRTYRTPLSAGPDGLLPDLEIFRDLVMEEAPRAFGAGVVRQVAITEAIPA